MRIRLIFTGLIAALAIGRGQGTERSGKVVVFREHDPQSLDEWHRCKQSCLTNEAMYGVCEIRSKCPAKRRALIRKVAPCRIKPGPEAKICCPSIQKGRPVTLYSCGRLCLTDDALYGVCRDKARCPQDRLNLSSLKETVCPPYRGRNGKICCPFKQLVSDLVSFNTEMYTKSVIFEPIGEHTIKDETEQLKDCGIPTKRKVWRGRTRRRRIKSHWRHRLAPYIVGGTIADPRRWPWIALIGEHIRSKTYVLCGGTLISKQHVLTAAHCVARLSPNKRSLLVVHLGEFDRSRRSDGPIQAFSVKRIIIHPKYIHGVFQHDLALLRLSDEAHFNDFNVRPLCLPSPRGGDYAGRPVLVAGWGVTSGHSREAVDVLREVKLSMMSSAVCEAKAKRNLKKFAYYFPGGFGQSKLCADSKEGGKGPCKGDSGGPAMVLMANGRYTLVGVVLAGKQRCPYRGEVPAIFTRVSAYLDWIRSNVK